MEDILKYMFEKNEEKIKINRDKNKEIINKIIDNAKKGYIVVSDKGCCVSGSRIAIKALTATLLEKLLEQKTIDKNDLNIIFKIARSNNSYCENKANKDRIKEILNKIVEDL